MAGDGRLLSRGVRAVAAGLVLCMVTSLCTLAGSCEDIRGRVVRLHVLAHSDSEADQALKLKVRDTVTALAAGMFDDTADAADALAAIEDKLPVLQAAAQQTVADEGYTYPVTVQICRMYFTTRQYDSGTLPAGVYDALRVTIGAGAGHNWWCVVFPPICVAAAAEAPTLDEVLPPAEEDIVTDAPQYEVRFKVVELFEGLCERVGSWFA